MREDVPVAALMVTGAQITSSLEQDDQLLELNPENFSRLGAPHRRLGH